MIVGSTSSPSRPDSVPPWIGLVLSAGMAVAWMVEQAVPNPDPAIALAPAWLSPVAAGTAAAGIVLPIDSTRWLRAGPALRWLGLLLLMWTANGLPCDVLTAAGLIGRETASGAIVLATVYWPGLAT